MAFVATRFAALAHGVKQFEAGREDGTQDHLLTSLRQQLRQFTREAEPTAGAID